MIYLLVFLYLSASAFLYKSKDKTSLRVYLLAYCVLTLLAGIRYNVGLDTIAYTKEFISFPKLSSLDINFIGDSKYRVLWILLESTIRTVTDSFYVFQTLLALFVNFSVFYFFWRNSTRPFLAILVYYTLFYFNLNMEILRESVPIGIMLLSFNLINERKWIKYLIFSFIASMFHESGFIMFLIPLFAGIKIKRTSYVVAVLLFAGISSQIYLLILKYVPNVFALLSINDYKLYYFESDFWINNSPTRNTYILLIIRHIILPLTILISFFKYLDKVVLNLIFLYVLLAILSLYLPILYRFRDYIFLFVILGLVNGLDIRYIYGHTVGYKIIAVLFLASFIYISLFREYYNSKSEGYQRLYDYYPYTSLFNENFPDQRRHKYYNTPQF